MLSPSRLIVPVLALGLFTGCVVVLLRQPRPGVAVDEVVAGIEETLLRRATDDGREDGGPVGPWWVAAESINEASGRIEHFRVTGGSIRVAARSARLVVDSTADTICFELFDVALTRFPPEGETGEGQVLALDHHVLGPVEYGRDIETGAGRVLVQAE